MRGTYHEALGRVIWNRVLTRDDSQEPGATRQRDGAGSVFFDATRKTPCPVPPYALGGEGVGTVDACGSGFLARRLRGRRVAVAGGPPNGTWQEFVVVDAEKNGGASDSVADEQAAMFFVDPITAYVLVHEVLQVRRGAWVLVTAAGSALGKSVVRMGRREGFRTICVVRSNSQHGGVAAAWSRCRDRDRSSGHAQRSGAHHWRPWCPPCARLRRRRSREPGRALPGPWRSPRALRHARKYADVCASARLDDAGGADRRLSVPNWLARQSPLKLLGVLSAVKKLTLASVFHTEVTQRYSLDQVATAVQAAVMPGRTGKVMLQISA